MFLWVFFDKIFGNKLSDDSDERFKQVMKLSDDSDERFKQVMKLSDKTKLQVIAKDDSEFKIRVLALLKLENDPKLFPLVDYTHDLHSRSIALEILNNKVVNGEERLGPVITYVSMYDPNPEIRARAKYYYSRLSAYSSFGTVIGIR